MEDQITRALRAEGIEPLSQVLSFANSSNNGVNGGVVQRGRLEPLAEGQPFMRTLGTTPRLKRIYGRTNEGWFRSSIGRHHRRNLVPHGVGVGVGGIARYSGGFPFHGRGGDGDGGAGMLKHARPVEQGWA